MLLLVLCPSPKLLLFVFWRGQPKDFLLDAIAFPKKQIIIFINSFVTQDIFTRILTKPFTLTPPSCPKQLWRSLHLRKIRLWIYLMAWVPPPRSRNGPHYHLLHPHTRPAPSCLPRKCHQCQSHGQHKTPKSHMKTIERTELTSTPSISKATGFSQYLN